MVSKTSYVAIPYSVPEQIKNLTAGTILMSFPGPQHRREWEYVTRGKTHEYKF